MFKKKYLVLLGLVALTGLFVGCGKNNMEIKDYHTDILGENVYIFTPEEEQTKIQETLDRIYSLQETAQFEDNRYAVYFMPGTYNVSADVAFILSSPALEFFRLIPRLLQQTPMPGGCQTLRVCTMQPVTSGAALRTSRCSQIQYGLCPRQQVCEEFRLTEISLFMMITAGPAAGFLQTQRLQDWWIPELSSSGFQGTTATAHGPARTGTS